MSTECPGGGATRRAVTVLSGDGWRWPRLTVPTAHSPPEPEDRHTYGLFPCIFCFCGQAPEMDKGDQY